MGGRVSGQRPTRRDRRVYSADAPAAGADWSLTVPSGHLYEIVSAYAQLVTSATSATREVLLKLTDGDATYLLLPPPGTQVASKTYDYAWAQHGGAYAGTGGLAITLPRLVLLPGWTIGSATTSIQAGDQWGTPRLLVLDTLFETGRVELDDVPELLVGVVGSTAG